MHPCRNEPLFPRVFASEQRDQLRREALSVIGCEIPVPVSVFLSVMMCRGVAGAGMFAGFAAVGTGVWEVGSIPLAILAVGLCASLRSRTAVALGAFLLASALATGASVSEAAPERSRVVDLVVTPESHWRSSESGLTLRARALRYRQEGRTRLWRAPVFITLSRLPEGERPPFSGELRIRGFVRRSPGLWNFGIGHRAGAYRVHIPHRSLLVPVDAAGIRSVFWRGSAAVREVVDRGLSRGAGELDREGQDRPSALFRALVLGDATELPDRWIASFRRTGIAHVLAVSGLHVGLVLWVALRCGAGLRPTWRSAAGIACMAFYLLLAGPRPSLVRATVMGVAALLSLLADRPRAVAPALMLAALFLVSTAPSSVTELGFQLTLAATAGILCVHRLVGPRLMERALVSSILTALAAQAVTAPFLLPRTGLVAVWSPIVNLVALPWVAVSLASSWLWLLFGLRATSVGRVWERWVDLCAVGPDLLASLPATVLPAGIGWRSGFGPMWVAGAAVGIAILIDASPSKRVVGVVAVGLVGVLGIMGVVADTPPAGASPELVLIDVGQGEAILIRDGEDAILVDGGGWRSGNVASSVLLPALAQLGVRRLRAVVPTHADRDHCGGLVELARLIDVGEVWIPTASRSEPCAAGLATSSPGPVRFLWRGRSTDVGRWKIEVLWPLPDARKAGNTDSLVLLATVHGRRVLLTGDIDRHAERAILDLSRPGNLSADVLKLAHHGSKSSTEERWIDAVAPRLAVVSAGAGNPYGHPARSVLERLRRRGVPVLRTDLAGAIRIHFPRKASFVVESAVGGV